LIWRPINWPYYTKNVSRRSGTRFPVFFNNCPKGQALRNAIMLKKIMGIIKELNPAQRFAMGWKD